MVGTSHYPIGGEKMSVLGNLEIDKPNDLSRLKELITDKKILSARILARKICNSPSPFCKDASLWHEYGKIVSRRNKRLSNHIKAQMTNCQNYSSQMHEDWLYGDIIYAIRTHNLENAKKLSIRLRALPSYHDSPITKAVSSIFEGEIAYAKRDYRAAVDWLDDVEGSWMIGFYSPQKELWFANEKWLDEARFYLLKAIIAKGKYFDKQRKEVYLRKPYQCLIFADILNAKNSKTIRFRATIINTFGRFANYIDDIIM